MNFTQEPADPSMMGTNKKGSTSEEIDKGKAKIEKTANDIAANPQVQKGLVTAKEVAKRAKEAVLGAIGLNGEQRQSQPQMPYQGGKRRRKSRRKKRTKRRRKSRRKKRRTKRRRKSRRKRRR